MLDINSNSLNKYLYFVGNYLTLLYQDIEDYILL